MNNNIMACPFCYAPIRTGQKTVSCDKCRSIHHEECWNKGNGCSVSGCECKIGCRPKLEQNSSAMSLAASPIQERKSLNILVYIVTLIIGLSVGAIIYHFAANQQKEAVNPSSPPQVQVVIQDKAADNSQSQNNTQKDIPISQENNNANYNSYERDHSTGSVPGRWPWTSGRTVYEGDLLGLSARELNIMRNEIFARHGWNFELEEFRSYFYSQSWYRPKKITRDLKTTNEEVVQEMTQLELDNAAKILEYQKTHGLL